MRIAKAAAIPGLIILLIITALVLLFGPDSPDRRRTSAAPASAPSPQLSPTAPPAGSDVTAPTASDLDRPAAASAALRVLKTWARPQVPHEVWWAALRPLLTPEAQESYEYTDPINIPALQVTGPAVEVREPVDPLVTTYYFETTAGKFGVDIARSPDGGPWMAYSIIFPDGESLRQ